MALVDRRKGIGDVTGCGEDASRAGVLVSDIGRRATTTGGISLDGVVGCGASAGAGTGGSGAFGCGVGSVG